MKLLISVLLCGLSLVACKTTSENAASGVKDLDANGLSQMCGQPSPGLAACLTSLGGFQSSESFQFWSATSSPIVKQVTSIHPSATSPGYIAHDFQVILNGSLADSSLVVSSYTIVDATGEHRTARWLVRTTAGWAYMPGTTDFELVTMNVQATPSNGPVNGVPGAPASISAGDASVQ